MGRRGHPHVSGERASLWPREVELCFRPGVLHSEGDTEAREGARASTAGRPRARAHLACPFQCTGWGLMLPHMGWAWAPRGLGGRPPPARRPLRLGSGIIDAPPAGVSSAGNCQQAEGPAGTLSTLLTCQSLKGPGRPGGGAQDGRGVDLRIYTRPPLSRPPHRKSVGAAFLLAGALYSPGGSARSTAPGPPPHQPLGHPPTPASTPGRPDL